MSRSIRVRPTINVITIENILDKGENVSETQNKIPFWTTSIYKNIQPLIVSMKLCGLYPPFENRCSFASILQQCHFIFVFSQIAFNLLRSFSAFNTTDDLGPIFFMKIQWIIWSLENVIKMVVFWVGLNRRGRIPLLFLKQDILLRQGLESFSNLRRVALAMFAMTILLPSLNVIFHMVCHHVSPRLSELQFTSRWPNFLNKSLPFWLKILFDLPIVYLNSAICTSAVCFFCLVCYLTVKDLQNLRTDIEKVTVGGLLTEDLSLYRHRFQELCDVIATLDSSFTYLIFLSLLAGMPLFCVVFYQAVYFAKSLDESIFFGFLLITVILYMGTSLLLPAWINSETRKLLPVLYKIRVNNDLKKQELEMLMFLSQLTGPDIGLSACNIIIITRHTTLTVAGMLLTYFLLLVQYRDSSQQIACHSELITNITKTLDL